MIYLFVHQNFPGQYQHLVRQLAAQRGNTVYFITQPNANRMGGVRKLEYRSVPPPGGGIHTLTVDFDLAVRTGAAVADVCRQLRADGVQPDLMVGHSGWGETLFLKDVFPEVPLLSYFEFYYHATAVDVGFDPEFESLFAEPTRLRVRNATNLLAFEGSDWGHTPTAWQHSLYPLRLRERISVLHEGVDTDRVRPDPAAWIRLARDGVVLKSGDEVVTYVARNLEPYRGFHTFMRALPELQRRRPQARVIIVGGDDVSYGNPGPPGTTWRELLLRELDGQLDLARIHFLGQVPYPAFLNLLQVSAAHVYLTYPFVLSWSFVEALASGCLVIGSATPPVLEVLEDGRNGLTVDFFAPAQIAARIDEALAQPERMAELRRAARATAVAEFDFQRRQLPRWQQLLADVAARRPVGVPTK